MPKIGFAPFLLTAVILSACSGAPDQRIAVPKAGIGATQNIAYRSVALREVSLPSYAASEEIYVADETGLLNSTEGLLWADDPKSSDALRSQIHLLRKALAEHDCDVIETVHGTGWRLGKPPAQP